MASEPMHDAKVVRIELTEEQKQRVADVLGEARLTASNLALELTAAELEQRIVPKILVN
jgi:hypothetical protein